MRPRPRVHQLSVPNLSEIDFGKLRAGRLARLQTMLKRHDFPVALLYNTANIRYATGVDAMAGGTAGARAGGGGGGGGGGGHVRALLSRPRRGRADPFGVKGLDPRPAESRPRRAPGLPLAVRRRRGPRQGARVGALARRGPARA